MTYTELKNKLEHLHVNRSSAKNCEAVRRVGLIPNDSIIFRGDNGKRYEVFVVAKRDYIGVHSKHRESTLEKHCG